MSTRMRGLAGTAVIAILVGITACGGKGSGSTSASSPAPSSPAVSSAATSSPAAPASTAGGTSAGGHQIGGSTQGISIEVPASFVVTPLGSASTIKAGLSKLGLSATAQAAFESQLSSLTKLNAVVAVDRQSVATNFVTNINAYCVASGTSQAGSAAVPSMKQAVISEFEQQLGATNVTSTDKVIGGIPGLETRYQLSSSTVGPVDGGQLEVAVKANKACFVTLTATASQFSDAVLAQAAASAQFP